VSELRAEQDKVRAEHAGRQSARAMLPISRARVLRTQLDWKAAAPPRPEFLGVRVLRSVPLGDIIPFIDWSPFFHTWELRGRYPQILEDPVVGAEARDLYANARRMLDQIVSEKWLEARAVYGFFAANSVGDDVELFADEQRRTPLAKFHFLRQQMERPAGSPHQCLADFVAPRDTGIADYLGGFAVSAGFGTEEQARRFKDDKDDYNAILLEALADRLAEALAEMLHKQVRDEWGYGRGENLDTDALIAEKYRGIRPAAGYPACPDHTEKQTLFDLLKVEKEIGMSLTESFAMHPASSVSGLYFSHPDAHYFSVGKVDRDQVLDYHKRKGMPMREVERWLAPVLNYDPA
jgi:5-methyltetrahydrofolate--homocysteine methyltransferase